MAIIKDNEFSGWGLSSPSTTSSDIQDDLKTVQHKNRHKKISLDNGTPQIYITDKKVTMTYNSNGVVISEDGTIIKGKMHLATQPENIRIGAFWTLNPELLTTIPSTTYTPISVLKYTAPPFGEMIAGALSLFA